MILNNGVVEGERLLSPTAIRKMVDNQIGDLRVPSVIRSNMPWSQDVSLTSGSPATWTAAFLRNEADLPGMRRAGSLTWAGFLNTHYWIDPGRGLGGVFLTRVMPFCDEGALSVYRSFERAVYAELS